MNNIPENVVHEDECSIWYAQDGAVLVTNKESGETMPGNVKDAIDSIWCTMARDEQSCRTMTRQYATDLFRRVLNRLHGEVTIGSLTAPGGDLYQQAAPVGFALDMMRCMQMTGYQLAEHSDSNPDICKLPLARLLHA